MGKDGVSRDTTAGAEIGDTAGMRPAPLFAAVAAITALTTLTRPSVAHADVFKLFVEAEGGGVFGKRLSGDAANASAGFFEKAPHGAYGGAIGAHFLFFDAVIQHHQFTNGSRLATWTQFGAGMRFEVDIGTQTKEDKKAGKGSYAEISANLFFGIGTGQQVDPPLSNDEITDKGSSSRASSGSASTWARSSTSACCSPCRGGTSSRTAAARSPTT